MEAESPCRVRLMIVDNDTFLRRGVVAVLSAYEDIAVVAEAGEGDEALALEPWPFPDVVLVGLLSPGIDGVETIRALHEAHPDARLIAFMGVQSASMLEQAIQAGAVGYLLKRTEASVLAQTIQSTHQDEFPRAPTSRPTSGAEDAPQSKLEPFMQLTPRECEVLTLLVQGHSDKYIAECLLVSPSTIKNYMRILRRKCCATNRHEVAIFAWKHRLVPVRSR
jgi:DNA-binding NarL/FixJ family response regulator